LIIYLDTSANLKAYIVEHGSADVAQLITNAQLCGSSMLCKVEMSAAITKAVRLGAISADEGQSAWDSFLAGWLDLVRLDVSDLVVDHAARLAKAHGLRGYDAVHLASALNWQSAIAESVRLATFDRCLWQAAAKEGLATWPEVLS